MKRLICFLTLLACFSLSAYAVPKPDGRFGPLEYNETLAVLQVPEHESNNNLKFAYLHWAASPADHSVYLALQYKCSDYAIEDGITGVMVYINEVLIGTIYTHGVEDVDHARYELEGVLDDAKTRTPFESFCELRVGIKFWQEEDIYAGLQILDFSGNPSNYYRQLVYSPQASTTHSDTTTTRKTTTEKSTAAQSATARPDPSSVKEATARSARTTVPVITASPSREATATTAAASAVQPTVLQPILTPAQTAAPPKTTKVKTTKPKTTKPKTTKAKTTKQRTTKTVTTAPSASAVMPAADSAVLTATTETDAAATTAAVVSNVQMYSNLNKVRIVGTVLVVVLLTAAIMSSVFLGMRQKQELPETYSPQEEYDDFG